jgi:hypothetical protein
MIGYITRHWIILILISIVWGTTLWIVHNKPKKISVTNPSPDTLILIKDSVKVNVDSLVQNIEIKKKIAMKKIHDLEKQKEKYEREAREEKQKRLKSEKEVEKQKGEKKQAVEIKEVVKEKKVYVQDPKLENEINHYQEENCLLKEELERSYRVNDRLREEKEDLKKTYSKQYMQPDTIRKRKKLLGLF